VFGPSPRHQERRAGIAHLSRRSIVDPLHADRIVARSDDVSA